MTRSGAQTPFVAIACGGTGGHLFPGLAVAGQLAQRGCAVTLLVSPKEVDQKAVKAAGSADVVTLPAVGLQNRNYLSFAHSFWQSWRAARKLFKSRPPCAVLAMGGFTSAPPVLAAKKSGAKTFLHESNVIPGRANRLLARYVDEAFIGFPGAAARLRVPRGGVIHTGTPVRPQFQPRDAGTCRVALGLDPHRPVILVMGGSQGASGINEIILATLPLLVGRAPAWQWLHLSGAGHFEKVRETYTRFGLSAVVRPFLAEMDLALGAATVAVSRAGASSLAEIAAMRLPSLLVPFPAAADNHQFHNARAFETTGAARLVEQKNATPGGMAALLGELVENQAARTAMQTALAQWHAPQAAEQIADTILKTIGERSGLTSHIEEKPGRRGEMNLKVVA
ncbi:MAG TPA: undecaprenyldiphospho-muramoylpentapeptide beta-N-acetylglucosaminyltransferase [Verrucomicrobiae bacterium]|nr:undecaprenyldiphospho-muramoylpentapeptide beta-N-acetylglucosaminyltransferase [Verrucomicrobiae bacterium]